MGSAFRSDRSFNDAGGPIACEALAERVKALALTCGGAWCGKLLEERTKAALLAVSTTSLLLPQNCDEPGIEPGIAPGIDFGDEPGIDFVRCAVSVEVLAAWAFFAAEEEALGVEAAGLLAVGQARRAGTVDARLAESDVLCLGTVVMSGGTVSRSSRVPHSAGVLFSVRGLLGATAFEHAELGRRGAPPVGLREATGEVVTPMAAALRDSKLRS